MQVAFATKDKEHVDDHFGWAKQFAIYEVGKESSGLVKLSASEGEYTNEAEKIAAKTAAIEGCAVLFCLAIGPTASAEVLRNNIYPMKVETGTTIAAAIESLQKMLNDENPPLWLKRIMAREGII